MGWAQRLIVHGTPLAAAGVLALSSARVMAAQEVNLLHRVDTSTATLAENMSFIRSFLADRSSLGTAWVKGDSCTVQWMQKDPIINRLVEENLSALDPTMVRLDSLPTFADDGGRDKFMVKSEATGAKKAIHFHEAVWRGGNYTLRGSDSSSTLTYMMRSRDDAVRFGKALQNGIRLCGGKAAPF